MRCYHCRQHGKQQTPHHTRKQSSCASATASPPSPAAGRASSQPRGCSSRSFSALLRAASASFNLFSTSFLEGAAAKRNESASSSASDRASSSAVGSTTNSSSSSATSFERSWPHVQRKRHHLSMAGGPIWHQGQHESHVHGQRNNGAQSEKDKNEKPHAREA